MTNREWINNLSLEELAKLCASSCKMCVCQKEDFCKKTCVKGIDEWLRQEHIEPMPELLPGDNILIDSGPYGMCNFIYIGKGKIFREYTGLINMEIAGKIVTVSRFNGADFEKIWEAD